MNAVLKRKTTKKQFEHDLMTRYSGDVEVCNSWSDGIEDAMVRMYLYYTTNGHCGTWMQGEGWEFHAEAVTAGSEA